MAPEPSGVRIAVNVMRARLTIVGFNLAIVTFQLNAIRNFAGGVEIADLGETVHLSADVALLLGVAFSVAAMVLFVAAGAFDSVGVVDHPAVIAGDICMYLALSQSIAGFFDPIVATLRTAVAALPAPALGESALVILVVTMGGIGWSLAFYLGPIVSLLRSPFRRATNIALVGLYILLVAVTLTAGLLAGNLEAAASAEQPLGLGAVPLFLMQPSRW
jgi:hypothetical protein